jgi:protein-export membrane protein, SecD/SecF family
MLGIDKAELVCFDSANSNYYNSGVDVLTIQEGIVVVRNRNLYLLILILIVTGLSLWIDFAPNDNWLGRDVSTRLGLDLQGGTQVLLRSVQEDVTAEQLQTAAGVVERRINGLGVGESVVQTSGTNRLIVELPGVANPEQAIDTLRGTGKLEFIDPQGQNLMVGQLVRTSGSPIVASATPSQTLALEETPIYPSVTDGADLDLSAVQPAVAQAAVGMPQRPAVAFAFRSPSREQLAQFTQQNVGRQMCIVLDNVVQSCPFIEQALVDGSGIISTQTREDADSIYNQLKYGALPIPLQVETSRTVTATLGRASVDASLVAGIVGLAVVGLFMIFYYRLPGLISVVALLIYTAITFALYRLIPITLTLAGIAGFILSIGLAVDANVLIFARLKEELRRKRELRHAIEDAFVESWPAIRDSNVATLITSTILYMFGNSFGVSIIKGFALTLGMGVVISLFTSIVVTRTLMRLILPLRSVYNPWLYGLDHEDQKEAALTDTGPAA